MLGFEPRISGVGSDRSANCATTTAQFLKNIFGGTNPGKKKFRNFLVGTSRQEIISNLFSPRPVSSCQRLQIIAKMYNFLPNSIDFSPKYAYFLPWQEKSWQYFSPGHPGKKKKLICWPVKFSPSTEASHLMVSREKKYWGLKVTRTVQGTSLKKNPRHWFSALTHLKNNRPHSYEKYQSLSLQAFQ